MYHEIAATEEAAGGLRDLGLVVLTCLDQDVTAPTEGEIRVYGISTASQKAVGRYIQRAMDGILKHGRELGACYRRRHQFNKFSWIEVPTLLSDLPVLLIYYTDHMELSLIIAGGWT